MLSHQSITGQYSKLHACVTFMHLLSIISASQVEITSSQSWVKAGGARGLVWLFYRASVTARKTGVKTWMELLCRIYPSAVPVWPPLTPAAKKTQAWAEEEGVKYTKKGGEERGGGCAAIFVGVNICCSACQGSIYRDGLTPGPLVEYWWGHGRWGGVCVCVSEREKEKKQNKRKTDSKKQKDGNSACWARTCAWSSCRVSASHAHLNRFLAFPEATKRGARKKTKNRQSFQLTHFNFVQSACDVCDWSC